MNVLAMVLAGGRGSRLSPLTRDRAKPAVPFGGQYRLIDFVLSNLCNSGFLKIVVLTQYKSHSLDRHLATTYRMSPLLGNYVTPVPAQMRRGKSWFTGSADALYQNFNLIGDEQPEHIIVFGADHLYRMDVRQMLDAHVESGAGATVAGIRVPREEATAFGVIHGEPGGQIQEFLEKPEDPPGLEDDPDMSFVSMGNYIFETEALMEMLRRDAENEDSNRDIGGDILPMFVESGGAYVYDFTQNDFPGSTDKDRNYWKDVGTIENFYQAHMDMISVDPEFNLYNYKWPMYSSQAAYAPAKFVFDDDEKRGVAVDSMVSQGVIISGGTVRRSVLSPRVRVRRGATVEDAILLDGVEVGRGATVRRAIIDKNVVVPEGVQIGVDREADEKRFHISDEGIVVIAKGDTVEAA